MCRIAVFSTDDAKLVKSIVRSKYKKAKIKLIITNKPDSNVIKLAEEHNIRCECFDHKQYPDRISHEKDIVRLLRKEKISLIIFAHYMRLITHYFVDRYRNRIINIHPSLLPDFKGANGYKDAFDADVSLAGCTLHYVDEGLDTGEIIMQKGVPRFKADSFYAFKNRILDAECEAIQELLVSMFSNKENIVDSLGLNIPFRKKSEIAA